MKILIADKLPAEIRVELQRIGFDVLFEPQLGAEDLPVQIGDARILVVRSTRVTEATLEAAGSLQLVIRAGAGTNTIDCKGAAARGIYVANCPGKNAIAVAELTMGLILSLDRRIPDNVSDLRAGRWNKAQYGKARGLYGRTLGIVGLGRIGQEVLTRARAFGLHCVAWSRSLTEERARALSVERCDSVAELCGRADIVSVHVARTPETAHLIGPNEIAAMRQGAFLVHMARGGVVDDTALQAAVSAGRIRAAGDVYEQEPSSSTGDFESPLGPLDGFYGTHHIAASTDQAQAAIAAEVLEIAAQWRATGDVRNAVNQAVQAPVAGLLLVRHLDRVGVLATVLDVLKKGDINVQEMHNTIFAGGEAACARISLAQPPGPETLADLASCSNHVLGVEYLDQ
ncbi:MAG: D-3-phosphoglycerate dehydrogenase [Myxococcota bacterium]